MSPLSAKHRAKISASTAGEAHWRTKLTRADVLEIYAARGKRSALALVMDFARSDCELTEAIVSSIWTGRRWASVTGARR